MDSLQVVSAVTTMDPMQMLTALIKPELLSIMTALVLVLQILRVHILKIESKDKLPKPVLYMFLGALVAMGYGLAWSWASQNTISGLTESIPIQGTFLAGFAILEYKILRNLFGSKANS